MSDAIIFEKATSESMILPVMSLREVVMFPKSIVPLFVGRDSSIKAIEMALDRYEKRIFLVTQKDPGQERPEVHGLFEVGTVSKVLQMLRLPDGTIKVLFEGLYRAGWDRERGLMIRDEIQMVRVASLPDREDSSLEGEALVRATHEAVEEYAQVNRKLAKETVMAITGVTQPGRLADTIAPHLKAPFDRKQAVLEILDPIHRLERVYELIQEEIEVFSLEKKIKGRVKKQMEENQKDYYLGEQLKAIHKEMGRDFDPKADVEELEAQLKAKNMPEEAREKAMAEVKKLRQTPPSSAEYAVLRNYVDWILALPWKAVRELEIDITDLEVGCGAEIPEGAVVRVEVNYMGKALSTGEQFDSSYDRGAPISFDVGAGGLIQGWDVGMVGMKEGGRRQLLIPGALAYGPRGNPPDIGPDDTLVFVIDLLSVQ